MRTIKSINLKHILMLLLLVSGTANAQIVNVPDTFFKLRLLGTLGIDTNSDGEIQLSEAQALTYLDVSNDPITMSHPISDMTGIEAFTNLRYLYCNNNYFNTLNVSGLHALQILVCSKTPQLTSLNVTGLTSLTRLECDTSGLTTLDVSSCTSLRFLYCQGSQLTSLNVSGLQNLQDLSCHVNHLTSLNVNGLTSLASLVCSENLLTSLNVDALINLVNFHYGNPGLAPVNISTLVNLTTFGYYGGMETSLDVSNFSNLQTCYLYHSNLTEFDVSALPNLTTLGVVDNISLTSINMKNGGAFDFTLNSSLIPNCSFNQNPNLSHVCTNEVDLTSVNESLALFGTNGTAHATTYCSVTPGGNYNTITGTTRFDWNDNGCDDTDIALANVRIDIDNGTENGGIFTDQQGNYALYTEAGSFTMTPNFENPSWFHFTPSPVTVSFADDDNHITTQNFCMSPTGIHNDVEVVLSPISGLRPGFDATYHLVYKNKGNQTLSGNVDLIFDGARLDFVSAFPAVDSQVAGGLSWNYSDLHPFETRAIDLVLNAHSPLENPSVNIGNILNFTAAVNPIASDGVPEDNIFDFNQTAVNSFDPNEKIGLEGNSISPQQIGKYLHYAINFENLGTSEAVNVVVKDSIDVTKFDISSLQVIHASNNVTTRISGNVVEFIFSNINLEPLSGDPPVGGHGSILFKIKTLPTLSVGEEVSNEASIYFDYNAPVATNAARTRFSLLGTSEFKKDNSVIVYPNPVKDFIRINCDHIMESIVLYDLQGRILETLMTNKREVRLDLSAQSNGIYFIVVKTDAGKNIQKIIKE